MERATKTDKNRIGIRIVSVLIALVLWQVLSMVLDQKLLLVSPIEVLVTLCRLIVQRSYWSSVIYSLLRIVAGFALAWVLGIALGILAGQKRIVELLLWPYITAIKSVPVVSFIILALIWLSGSTLSIFISFLMVFPIIYGNVLEGIKSTDMHMLQMASVFRLSWAKKAKYIYLPQLKPYILAATSTALGIAWKAGIAAEVIGIPRGSIGEKLYEAKIYFSTGELFAWTITIVILSVGFEKLFVWMLRKIYDGAEKR